MNIDVFQDSLNFLKDSFGSPLSLLDDEDSLLELDELSSSSKKKGLCKKVLFHIQESITIVSVPTFFIAITAVVFYVKFVQIS